MRRPVEAWCGPRSTARVRLWTSGSIQTPWVTVPGSEGELGILPQHIPLVTTLGSGVLAYEENGQRKQAAVHYGYAQVAADTVTLLSQMVELSGEIDLERAREAERKAREKLSAAASGGEEKVESAKFEAKLKRSTVRQQAVK